MDRKRPSFLGLSPLDLFRPSSAGKFVSESSTISIGVSLFCASALLTIAVVAVVVWDQTLGIDSGAETEQVFVGNVERSWSEAWQVAYGRNFFAGVGLVFLWMPPACALFVMLSAWTHWIDVHRRGSPIISFGMAVRVAASSLWVGLVMSAALGTIGVLLDHYWLTHPEMFYRTGPPPWAVVLAPGIPISGLLLALWTRRALDAATPEPPAMVIEPKCEGCGYCLVHRPADGLCPECGISVDSSLRPSVRRSGSPWEINPNLGTSTQTVLNALRDPRSFYSSLQLRSAVGPAHRFARYQLFFLAVGAWIWLEIIVFLATRQRARFEPMLFFPTAGAAWIVFIGWGLHRLIAAGVFSDWLRRNALPDYFWARKVFLFETAFLWVFCLFNGLIFSSIVANNGLWMTELLTKWLGHRFYIHGMPVELFLVPMGNIALCGLWIWRYYIALAAIRWSNF